MSTHSSEQARGVGAARDVGGSRMREILVCVVIHPHSPCRAWARKGADLRDMVQRSSPEEDDVVYVERGLSTHLEALDFSDVFFSAHRRCFTTA